MGFVQNRYFAHGVWKNSIRNTRAIGHPYSSLLSGLVRECPVLHTSCVIYYFKPMGFTAFFNYNTIKRTWPCFNKIPVSSLNSDFFKFLFALAVFFNYRLIRLGRELSVTYN